jgi:DNA-binding XRE family transcriptional regulator
MRYKSRTEFTEDNAKSVLLFGMSGVGKSFIASVLSSGSNWSSHSIDKKIFELLRSQILADYTVSERPGVIKRIESGDLSPLVNFLGLPGAILKGGVPFGEYLRRQEIHAKAESLALIEAPQVFDIARSETVEPKNFVCDTGGSICEVLHPFSDHRLLSAMSRRMLFVYISADESYDSVLIERFRKNPKPMYYNPQFLREKWSEYTKLRSVKPEDVDPTDFSVWGFKQLLERRRPIYESFAKRWGVKVTAVNVAKVRDEKDFIELVGQAIDDVSQSSIYRNKKIGKLYFDQRLTLKYTKKLVAQRIGIQENVLSQVEKSRVMPSDRLEQRLYELLYLDPFRKRASYQPIRGNISYKPVTKKKSQNR